MAEQHVNVTTSELLSHDDGRVRVLTLNRPERLNALSITLQHQLTRALLDAAADDAVSVVVLTGAETRAFCSGVDLKELGDVGPGWRGPYRQTDRTPWEVLAELGKPTVAAVEGMAVGGGFELALACDMIVAARQAKFAMPEARRGMAAAFGTAILPRRVPYSVACELLFTGEPASADELHHWGLVRKLTEPGDALHTAVDFGRLIAGNAPLSLRRMKETMVANATQPLAAAIRTNVGPDPYASRDRHEGVRAFVEKRPPRWTGT